ncbi:unnamed protein product, partial [Owenia fusiformis]
QLNSNPDWTIKSHKSCVSTYTSKFHIERELKRTKPTKALDTSPVLTKRVRRSDIPTFNFLEHCIFCGEICKPLDPHNPKRWKKVIECKTADRGDKGSFKHNILQKCEERGDEWSKKVEVRLQGAVSDLHAADGRYHQACYHKFMNACCVKKAASSCASSSTHDLALYKVSEEMKKDFSKFWNTNELYELYCTFDGEKCRRSFTDGLSEIMNDYVVLSSPGYANIL